MIYESISLSIVLVILGLKIWCENVLNASYFSYYNNTLLLDGNSLELC